MTKEEIIKRWRSHVAGVIALGSARVRKLVTGPIESAAAFGDVVFHLDETAETLISKLYDAITQPEPPAKNTNGHQLKRTP